MLTGGVGIGQRLRVGDGVHHLQIGDLAQYRPRLIPDNTVVDEFVDGTQQVCVDFVPER